MKNTRHLHILLLIAFLFAAMMDSRANMAMPYHGENLWGEPFTNASVDILREDMHIALDDSFRYADYTITYTIQVHEDSLNVPMLFYAFDYRDSFRVWVDDREVPLLDVPVNYADMDSTPFEDFRHLFQFSDIYDDQRIIIEESARHDWHIMLEDLKFFDTDMGAGQHTIRVEYRADAWLDEGGVINAYSFRYVLSPAALWKSFGQLNVTLDATRMVYPLTTNLGDPVKGSLENVASWTFDSIPVSVLEIYYNPEINPMARSLLSLSPFGLALIPTLLLVFLVLLKAYRFRTGNHVALANPWVYFGALILPGLFLILWVLGYPLIKAVIGPEASRVYGYMTIMVMVLYPPIAIVSLLAGGAADLGFRYYLRRHTV